LDKGKILLFGEYDELRVSFNTERIAVFSGGTS
jgi:hypothetical protein